MHWRRSRPRLADASLAEAEATSGRCAPARRGHGRGRSASGKPAALTTLVYRYTKALQASPESAFLSRPGPRVVASGTNDLAAAVADLRRAATLEPADADGSAALAAALAAGQLRESEADLPAGARA